MLTDLRLKDYFLFTQNSIATFDNCPLKFKKRYMETLKWDSFPDEEIKKRVEMGNDFHLLAHRYFIGTDTGLNYSTEEPSNLEKWIHNLAEKFKLEENTVYLPEHKLRMISPPMKLEANFDLLLVKDDKIEIWDWKTHSNKKSNGNSLLMKKKFEESLQTVVYMYVLKENSALITGKDIKSKNISMHYWQPDPPKVIAEVNYSDSMHKRFEEILGKKINSILEYDYNDFDKRLFTKHCKYCEFNWFCNNEKLNFETMDDDDIADELDWDTIEAKY